MNKYIVRNKIIKEKYNKLYKLIKHYKLNVKNNNNLLILFKINH